MVLEMGKLRPREVSPKTYSKLLGVSVGWLPLHSHCPQLHTSHQVPPWVLSVIRCLLAFLSPTPKLKEPADSKTGVCRAKVASSMFLSPGQVKDREQQALWVTGLGVMEPDSVGCDAQRRPVAPQNFPWSSCVLRDTKTLSPETQISGLGIVPASHCLAHSSFLSRPLSSTSLSTLHSHLPKGRQLGEA